jgi:hypothetical protein
MQTRCLSSRFGHRIDLVPNAGRLRAYIPRLRSVTTVKPGASSDCHPIAACRHPRHALWSLHFQALVTDIFVVIFPARLLNRFRWLSLPGALLLALLQRTPMLRVLTRAELPLAPPTCGAVLRSALATIASLGSIHAQTGATQWTYSRAQPYTGTAGVGFAPLGFTVTGAQTPAGSFRVTNLPPGLIVNGANAAGLLNASSGLITGTPTTAGTFTATLLAHEFANATGDTVGPTTIQFVIAPGVPVPPTFSVQPVGQSVSPGASVTFTAAASGLPPPTFQWRRNGTNIIGANAPTLALSNVQVGDAGDYSVLVSSSAGQAMSDIATLIVRSTERTARLSNLSVRTAMAAGQTLIVGVVVDDGSRDILVRAAGPALAAFGLNAMVDPLLELYNGASMVLANNDWSPTLAPMFESVGAFVFSNGSKDAAFVQRLNAAYSIQARGTGPGVVLVEAYDTGAPTTARLVNVSARNRVGPGDDILIAGFNISGTGAKPLLIRAVGPKLGDFGVGGLLSDPKLEIYDAAGVKVIENDNWNSGLAALFSSVGAFALDTGSRDAALVATLPPGSYTAQVRGADGGTGEALIEIYELP